MQPGFVLVTAGSEAEAQKLAQALVEARLAACVSFWPMQSVYVWQAEIHHEAEFQLVIKTDLALFEALSAKICELHRYDVPEIVAFPISQGSAPYLNWLRSQVER